MTNREIMCLVKRIKEQEKNAFDELYDSMWHSVYYTVFKQVKNYEDATDLSQEIFLKVSRQIYTLKNDAAFITWLNTIIINHCNTYLSSNRKKDEMSIDEFKNNLFENKIDFLPEEILLNRELCQTVSDIVSMLPNEQRQAILLYYYNDLSTKEISQVLKTTPHAIEIKLSRARATIKSKIEALQKKEGIYMYNMAAASVLARILKAEAEQVCTLAVRDQILSGIQASIAAQTSFASGSAIGKIGINSAELLIAKISAGILTLAIIGGTIVGGLYLVKNKTTEGGSQNQLSASDPAEPDKTLTNNTANDFLLFYSEGNIVYGTASSSIGTPASTATSFTINLTSPVDAPITYYFTTRNAADDDNYTVAAVDWVLKDGLGKSISGNVAFAAVTLGQCMGVVIQPGYTGVFTLTVGGRYVVTFNVIA